jgi:ribose transport system substrate-binding protein
MKIAVFTKNLSNPAYAAARLGAERAAALFGARVDHFVPSTPDDPGEQSELVARALEGRPDAVVIAPVHPTRVTAAIESIHDAGIPVFGFVNRIPGNRGVSFVGSSDSRLGRDVARALFEHLGGEGDVAIVEGPADSPTSIERVRAFEEEASRHPRIRIVAHCAGDYLREPARDAFAQVLRRCERIDGVLAANDIMAIGALEALRDARRGAAVVGVNAIPQAVEAIGRGEMLATADFNAMQMCFLAAECALRHVRGESVPREIELPVRLVDRSNWTQWNLPYERRELCTLAELAA